MAFALVFDSVGAGEWLLLLAVLLVVVGPQKLPGMLRSAGNHYAKFRRMADSFRRQLMDMDTEFERAVNEAEREAAAAASIPDITELNPAANANADNPDDPDGPAGPESPETAAEADNLHGDRPSEES